MNGEKKVSSKRRKRDATARDSSFALSDAMPSLGDNKAIGVFGGLEIHGKPRNVTWTKLNETARAGASRITLEQAVDWEVGEELVIATTSYDLNQAETFAIVGVSSDRRTLTLNGNLLKNHLVVERTYDSGAHFRIAAAVGLLSRNVKIVGAQSSTLYGEMNFYFSRISLVLYY